MNPDIERLLQAGLDVPRIAVSIVKVLIVPALVVVFLGWLQFHFFSRVPDAHQNSHPGESCQAEVRGVIREPFAVWQKNEERDLCDKLIETGQAIRVEPWYIEQYNQRHAVSRETPDQSSVRKESELQARVKDAKRQEEKDSADVPDCAVRQNGGYAERYCADLEQQTSEKRVSQLLESKHLSSKWNSFKERRGQYCADKLTAEGYTAGIGSYWAIANARCEVAVNEKLIAEISNAR